MLVLQGDGAKLSAIEPGGVLRWTHDLAADGVVRIGDMQAAGASGAVAVLDDNAERIVVIGRDGRLLRSLSTKGSGHVDAFAALPDGRLWAVTGDLTHPLVGFDDTGTLVTRKRFPAAWFMELNPIARQGLIATQASTERWAFAAVFGDRVAVLDARGDSIASTTRVGASGFPDVIKIETGSTTEERLGRMTYQVSALAFHGDDVLILAKAADGTARFVDRYAGANVRYVESFAVPMDVSDLTVLDGHVLLLQKTAILELTLPK